MKLNTHLRFNDGVCKEAMEFYQSCLGGEVSMMTVADSPMASQMPDKHGYIMHAVLTKNGVTLLSGSDMMQDTATLGDNIAIMVDGDSETEAQALFAALTPEGDVFMPLERQFWGGLFGIVTDKYGIEWAISFMERKQ